MAFILKKHGFTLLECIFALLALSIVLVGVTQLISLSARASVYSADAYKSGMLLSGLIAELQQAPPDLTLQPTDEVLDIWSILDARDIEYTIALKAELPDRAYYFTNNLSEVSLDNNNSSYFFDAIYSSSNMSLDLLRDSPIASSAGIVVEIPERKKTPLFVTIAAYTGDGRFLNVTFSYIEIIEAL